MESIPPVRALGWCYRIDRHDAARLALTITAPDGVSHSGDAYYATRPRGQHDAESISDATWALLDHLPPETADHIVDHIMSTAEEHLPILNGGAPTTR